MKTKEFIKKVEELGYRCHEYGDSIAIIASLYGYTLAVIDKKEMYSFVIGSDLAIYNPEKFITDRLLELIAEYAQTPIPDREEEKKFYLKHRYFRFDDGSNKYLGIDLVRVKPDLYSKITYRWVNNQFTKKEIEEIKEKFNTDLADFELVEVKDED